MRLIAFLLLVGLVGVGLLRLLYRVHRLNQNRATLNLFVTKLHRFAEEYQEQFDSDLYFWLNHRVMAVHKMASDPSFWRAFGSRFEETAVQSAESLVATLEDLGKGPVRPSRVMSLLSFLTRFLGVLDDSIEKIRKQRMNPLLLFHEGVLLLLALPVLAWGWITGSADSPFEELSRSASFRRRSGLLALAILVLSLVILVLGWAPIAEISRQTFSSVQTWFWEAVEDLRFTTPAEPSNQPQNESL